MNGLRHGRRSALLHRILPCGFNSNSGFFRQRVLRILRKNYHYSIDSTEVSLLQTMARIEAQNDLYYQ